MFRHMLPNAMVATLTLLPFIITGAIGGLAALDFLGLGLPPSYPSLGELALQGKNRLNAPWLGFTAFFTFADHAARSSSSSSRASATPSTRERPSGDRVGTPASRSARVRPRARSGRATPCGFIG